MTKKSKTKKPVKAARKTQRKPRVSLKEILAEIILLRQAVADLVNVLRQENRSNDKKTAAEMMFAALKSCASLSLSTRLFIDSLENGFHTYGSLTERQYECLYRNYRKYIKGEKFYG